MIHFLGLPPRSVGRRDAPAVYGIPNHGARNPKQINKYINQTKEQREEHIMRRGKVKKLKEKMGIK